MGSGPRRKTVVGKQFVSKLLNSRFLVSLYTASCVLESGLYYRNREFTNFCFFNGHDLRPGFYLTARFYLSKYGIS